ncbi:hypothetical protein BCU94_10130 [Shewanella sp. 10N.286.52.C2]|uniref:hypothetical protein n=1 Tax=unclassified Shewanella TaxID=196818 RepID=UPI000C836A56|nr:MULTISPECIES: hypothetical protein [unclassified Shewanella]MDO6620529.1 hypothetical protein [Shewanella sp. 6_MG-2023]MDO6777210.1 hypothetical protein [Shewanella sp. 3_MG-2023]PMG30928.1 hypothetical protein BCU94_10130 [Shewanella sp. 10N.286.52.C2]
MKTICFNILNCAATQLPSLHQLSDAGAGSDLMHFTPTRDSEIIANGQANTVLPLKKLQSKEADKYDGLLSNGGISPAVLSRGLLKLLASNGYNIEFHSYNFNVSQPHTMQEDWLVQSHHGGRNIDSTELIETTLIPSLVDQAQRGCISILSECGVGGTTFSTLWLRLLTGMDLSPAGSTIDPKKLAIKQQLLNELECQYRVDGENFDETRLLANPRFHDPIQLAVSQLIKQWPTQLPMPTFAGGMMFVAPLLAARKTNSLAIPVLIHTTRWVLNGDGKQVLSHLGDKDVITTHTTNFSRSDMSCLQCYEQGLVVEGCGLGGLLVLAETLGINEPAIIKALELAVNEYQRPFLENESVA